MDRSLSNFNPNVLPCAVISSEAMSSEEESLKLILFNPTEMTMVMPCLTIYLLMCSLQHHCAILLMGICEM
jgi:hypothetical protein